MSSLIKYCRLLIFGGSLLVIIGINNSSFSQNLIPNPNFSRVEVRYLGNKRVRPLDWFAFEGSRPKFVHPAMKETSFPPPPIVDANGAMFLNILRYNEGIFTRLISPLVAGQEYSIDIALEKIHVRLNSDHYNEHGDIKNEKKISLDSIDLDYNYPIKLVAFFSNELPSCNMTTPKHYVIIDIPDDEVLPMRVVKNLSSTYTAKGGELYFGVSLCNQDEYLAVLNDTVDYYHKWARYGFYSIDVEYVKNICLEHGVNFENNADWLPKQSKFTIKNVTFDHNQSKLSPQAQNELKWFSSFLKSNPKLYVRIEGHTDTTGTVEYNQNLSERRATVVYDYLCGQGIDATRMEYEGRGELFPLDSIEFVQNGGVNRRVEFELVEQQTPDIQ